MDKIKPKKSLGQNFLRDEEILKKIISVANINTDDFILEIGPGEGVLTAEMAKVARKVLAIEIDHELIGNLKKRFSAKEKIEIIQADILTINLPEIIQKNIPNQKYKLIANIPYYITSKIIRLFLETTYPPTEMLLMVQKEVAERIIAKPGQLSILALSVQYYATPELLFIVPRKAFFPIPEVDSAIIKISLNKNAGLKSEDSKRFFRVVKAGFSAKRKTLANNLSASLKITKTEATTKITSLGLGANIRAQELSLAEWKKIAELF